MSYIALVGFIGSGKDTVAQQFVNTGAVRDSFAKPLKDVCAAVFGWDRELLEGDTVESRDFRETPDMFWSRKTGIPNFSPRIALQLVGTDVMRNHFHKNIWIDSLEYRLRCNNQENKTVVISDARFQNELALVRDMGGKVVWVQRGELPEWYDEAAKANSGNTISRKIMETRYKDVHESEWNWVGFDVDFTLYNDGSLEELKQQVSKLERELMLPKLRAI